MTTGGAEDEDRLVREGRDPVLLGEVLDRVGDDLEQAQRADPVRPRALLQEAQEPPFEPYAEGGDDEDAEEDDQNARRDREIVGAAHLPPLAAGDAEGGDPEGMRRTTALRGEESRQRGETPRQARHSFGQIGKAEGKDEVRGPRGVATLLLALEVDSREASLGETEPRGVCRADEELRLGYQRGDGR